MALRATKILLLLLLSCVLMDIVVASPLTPLNTYEQPYSFSKLKSINQQLQINKDKQRANQIESQLLRTQQQLFNHDRQHLPKGITISNSYQINDRMKAAKKKNNQDYASIKKEYNQKIKERDNQIKHINKAIKGNR